jgi:hypothetical protein
MPFVALALLHAAAGFAAALAYVGALRASPRASWTLPGFAALCLHEALVAVPAAFYLLVRHTDWMLSYTLPTGWMPSALALVLAVLLGSGALATFVAGAHLVREQRPRVALVLSVSLAAVALLGLALVRGRVGQVGSTSQFRGGFGMLPFGASRAALSVVLTGVLQAAAFAHLTWTLSRVPSPTDRTGP